jgi:hypothetical protein
MGTGSWETTDENNTLCYRLGGLVVIARANVPGKCTPVACSHLVDDAKGIGPHFPFDGKTEIDLIT